MAKDGIRNLSHRRARLAALHLIFLLSGAAGLGYQMVFVRMFAVGLGHEITSVLAVVGAFFGGLGLGAWLLGGPVERSRNPGLWYVGLEVLICVWGFGCVWTIGAASDLALEWTGTNASGAWQWAMAFGVPLIVLLPATMAMGATLPAMDRCASPLTKGGRCIGGLYAVNTAGAVVGTLVGTFFIVPWLGFSVTLISLAVVNLVCAVLMLPMARRVESKVDGGVVSPLASEEEGFLSRRGILLLLFATGFLGIGYEVVALRVIAHIIENTVYSYAAALSVYLIGTALGAAIWQAVGGRWSSPRSVGFLMVILSTTCLVGTWSLSICREVYRFVRLSLGDSALAVLASEMTVASLVFLLPTVVMGATFSCLTQAAKRGERGVGAAVAINTMGGFIAPLLAGVILIPLVGTKWSLVALSLGYSALVLTDWRFPRLLLLVPLLMAFLIPSDLHLITVREGDRVGYYREGVMASVAIVVSADGRRNLRVNNRHQMGGTGAASTRMELRQGHVPLLLHPAPDRALFLGVGSGITAMAAGYHGDLEADAVELVPEVVQAIPGFKVDGRSLLDMPTVQIHTADARRFVRVTRERYEVIVADLFHPARDGAGMLYTVEHFEAIGGLLSEGGLFCQWIPAYQMDAATIRTVVRTFLQVYPDARIVMHDVELNYPALGLIGAKGAWPEYGGGWLESRVGDASLRRRLALLGISRDVELFGLLVSGADGLREFAGSGSVNTDDRPIVVYRAPMFSTLRDTTSYGRLLGMLREVAPERNPWNIRDSAVRTQVLNWIAMRNKSIERAIEKAAARRKGMR